jgi:hypothetical protein
MRERHGSSAWANIRSTKMTYNRHAYNRDVLQRYWTSDHYTVASRLVWKHTQTNNVVKDLPRSGRPRVRLSSGQWILRHVLKFQPRRAKHHAKRDRRCRSANSGRLMTLLDLSPADFRRFLTVPVDRRLRVSEAQRWQIIGMHTTGMSFKAIGRQMGYHYIVVSRPVRKHTQTNNVKT